MKDKLIFSNGDSITINENGNTYIGEYAHLAMNTYYKLVREAKLIDSTATQKVFYNEMVKQGIVKKR